MTTVGDIVTALVDTCSAANVPDIAVSDGQAYDPDGDFLAVAWAGEDQPGFEFAGDPSDYGQEQSTTVVDVTCLLTLHRGDWDNHRAVRAELLDTFRLFAVAIRGSNLLTGLLMRPAQVNTGQVQIVGDEGGIEGRLGFVVTCTSSLTP